MKLAELLESVDAYKTELQEKEAWDILNKHCKDALENPDAPIMRGLTWIEKGFAKIDGSVGNRKSQHTTNFYTTILDAVLSSDFPKRSKSIICANWKNRAHANNYGKLYAIIPYDGVKIAVCPEFDIWETKITFGKSTKRIVEWNSEFAKLGISDDVSFDELAKILNERALNSSKPQWLRAFKIDSGKVLQEAYRKPFVVTTTKNPVYNDGGKHELWIGGPCIAVDAEIYRKIMKNPPYAMSHDNPAPSWFK